MTAKTQAAGPSRGEQELSLIYELTRRSLSCHSLDEFWPILTQELLQFFSCDRFTCFFVEGDQLKSRWALGVTQPIVLKHGEGIAGYVAATLKTYLCKDPYGDPLFKKQFDLATSYKTESILCGPFQHEGRSVGVIELFNKRGGFSEDDARSMDWISPHVGFIIAKLTADEKLRELDSQVAQTAKMSTLGFLVGGIVHDINNPLTAIKSSASLVKSITKDQKIVPSIDIISEACKRCEGIIQGVLTFIRKYDVTAVPTSVYEAVESAEKLSQYQARSARVKVVNQLPASLPRVMASPNQLLQIVLNLIINGIQAMPDGGTLTVSSRVANGLLELDVADQGVGLDAAAMEKLFKPFFTTKPIGKGTGLGLSLCKSMASKFGADLSAHSDGAGKGATFRLTLKTAKSDA